MKRAATLPMLALMVGCTTDDLDLFTSVYFVKLDAEPAEVAGLANDLAGLFGLDVLHTYDSATQGFSVRLPDALVPDLRDRPEVEYVHLDEPTEKVPPEETETGGGTDGTAPDPDEVPESIGRVGGPFLGPLNGIEVAVIDTGIDTAHKQLNVVAYEDFAAVSGADPADGEDPNGHGTHVAGTIGAIQDGKGVVGMAPGVPLHALRVLDASGAGYTTDIVAALEYVLDHPEIRVVNLSLGGPATSGPDPMRDAIEALEDAGVVVVIAAGNEAQDTENVSPAGYDLGVVVSAYDAAGGDNGWAWFSNYGDAVDVAAPGVGILSTWTGGGNETLDGTSMATPCVAGAVAGVLAVDPGLNAADVRALLEETGETGVEGANKKHGETLLDAAALFAAVGG